MSDTMSSSSTLNSSPAVETSVLKSILGTTEKLNSSNYLLWTQAFHIFIGAQNKLTHLLKSLPPATHPLIRPSFLEIIAWWRGFSTIWKRRLVVVSYSWLLVRRCGISWRWC